MMIQKTSLAILAATAKANWGGLVNRGGGSKDYREVNWEEDLMRIECGVDKPNTGPWSWDRNTEYILTVERGSQVRLPAGTNAQFNVMVPDRTMWIWNFTIRPVNGDSESYHAFLKALDYIPLIC